MNRHEKWMAFAIQEAGRAKGRTSPNPLVGCAIVKNEKLIASGFHKRAGGPHAEISALRKAGKAAKGADVYVNLEPCDHKGRTGPCTSALIAHDVGRVFVAMRDPNPLVNGRGIRQLRRSGIKVQQGICRKQARKLNETFIHKMHTGQPMLVAKIAQSLDGKVATHTGQSQWITGPKARKEGHKLRSEHDAIMVGIGTILSDDPRLNCRNPRGRDPLRIILDSQARTPIASQTLSIIESSSAGTLIVCANDAPKRKVTRLAAAGAEILQLPRTSQGLCLKTLLTQLGQRDILSVLLEGGPTLLGSFLSEGLIQKFHIFMSPQFIGGTKSLAAMGGVGFANLADTTKINLEPPRWLGPDLHFVGYPKTS
jgi:diaminohydroxyphosphoribosylaminopyrimidine deaminase / 5-amino-6-(5-phosphoribosylamino)uracil reductase